MSKLDLKNLLKSKDDMKNIGVLKKEENPKNRNDHNKKDNNKLMQMLGRNHCIDETLPLFEDEYLDMTHSRVAQKLA